MGIAYMPDHKDYISGKYVYASLVCTFRHGREEDEVMGISFTKELVLDRQQIYPSNQDMERTKLQASVS